MKRNFNYFNNTLGKNIRLGSRDFSESAFYTIQPGDTLGKLGTKFDSSALAIARANGIQNPDRIFAGQKLFIPGKGLDPLDFGGTTGAKEVTTNFMDKYYGGGDGTIQGSVLTDGPIKPTEVATAKPGILDNLKTLGNKAIDKTKQVTNNIVETVRNGGKTATTKAPVKNAYNTAETELMKDYKPNTRVQEVITEKAKAVAPAQSAPAPVVDPAANVSKTVAGRSKGLSTTTTQTYTPTPTTPKVEATPKPVTNTSTPLDNNVATKATSSAPAPNSIADGNVATSTPLTTTQAPKPFVSDTDFEGGIGKKSIVDHGDTTIGQVDVNDYSGTIKPTGSTAPQTYGGQTSTSGTLEATKTWKDSAKDMYEKAKTNVSEGFGKLKSGAIENYGKLTDWVGKTTGLGAVGSNIAAAGGLGLLAAGLIGGGIALKNKFKKNRYADASQFNFSEAYVNRRKYMPTDFETESLPWYYFGKTSESLQDVTGLQRDKAIGLTGAGLGVLGTLLIKGKSHPSAIGAGIAGGALGLLLANSISKGYKERVNQRAYEIAQASRKRR